MPGATRTVSVSLQARTAGYIANMRTAGKATATAFAGADKRFRKNRESLNTLATGFGIVGLAAAAGVGKAIKSFADFDEAMSSVQAATHETTGNMNRLRAAALQAGIDTKFSATEAAAGVENLAKAGVSTSDILGGGLVGALDLAAAGELDVATAAETAATAMTQFQLSGKQIPHLADLLAAGAGKAQGDVNDLAMAMKQGGLVASQFGLSIEETVGTMSAFASAGLTGSDAGTSFKQMLLSLGNPSKKAAGLMKELGIETYDAQGNFIGVTKLAGELRKELGDLTPAQRNAALATIFGSDAIRAANVLYEQGQSGIQGWIDKVNDQGYAAETAAIKMDNLAGDVEQFGGSLETAFINAGSGGNEFARSTVQNVQDVVDAFNDLTPAQQKAALEATALVAAVGLAGAGLLKMVIAVNETRAAIEALTGRTITLRAALTGLAGAAVVFGAAIAAVELTKLIAKARVADVSTANLTESLKSFGQGGKLGSEGIRLFGAETGAFGAKVDGTTQSLETLGVLSETVFGDTWVAKIDRIHDMGGSMTQLKEITGELDPALAQLAKQDPTAAANAFARFSSVMREQGATQAEITALFPKYTAAANAATSTAKANAAAHRVVDAAMRGETVSAEQLNAALKQLASGALGTEQAQISFQQALKAAGAAAKSGGAALKGNSTAALANRQAMVSAANAAFNLSNAIYEQTGSQEQANAAMAASRARLVQVARGFGLTKKEADAYVTSVLGIPKVTKTDHKQNANKSKRDVDNYRSAIEAVPASKTTRFTAKTKKGLENIRAYADAIAGIPSRKTTTVTVRRRTGGIEDLLGGAGRARTPGGSQHGQRAHGGPVLANRTYKVGERGTELLTLGSTSGFVTPADETARLLGGMVRAEQFTNGSGAMSGGMFEGTLVLDNGAFVGQVRGVLRSHDREMKRDALAGTGRAR